MLPTRNCLVLACGWNTNMPLQEFKEQATFLAPWTTCGIIPATEVGVRVTLHFLRKLGVKDIEVVGDKIHACFSAKWVDAGAGQLNVRWCAGTFEATSGSGIGSLGLLWEAYAGFLNGGNPPDEECIWTVPPASAMCAPSAGCRH